ncbi:unnamed protein product [Prunus armeniaca]|uniref:Pectinesterase catalytic domain-containing protein n=1 Tax=Prunus armeniaca TaxID=36596 RepID=A0A6J5WF42_PRUAR|nr:unnamed protein product [Prunus armeniaca]
MKSYLGDMINPQEWSKWDDYRTVETVEYIEYLNFGPGSDTRHMVKWGGYKKNCSEEIAGQFTVGLFLPGAGEGDREMESKGWRARAKGERDGVRKRDEKLQKKKRNFH